MQYYALYVHPLGWEEGEPAVGIVVTESHFGPGMESYVFEAMHWDHVDKAWTYDPNGNADMMSDHRFEDRFTVVTREEAERITPAITGGEPLPTEDQIRWLFQWKGNPPRPQS